jgi:hypothetical protein
VGKLGYGTYQLGKGRPKQLGKEATAMIPVFGALLKHRAFPYQPKKKKKKEVKWGSGGSGSGWGSGSGSSGGWNY